MLESGRMKGNIKHGESKYDFLAYTENLKYDRAFVSYKMLDWWPFLDFLATHGHFVCNAIIVVCASMI